MSSNKSESTRTPKMEGDICTLFDSGLKEAALAFAAYLNANQLTPVPAGANCWKIPYEKYSLCMIQLEPNKWRLTFFFGEYSGDFDEGFVTAVQEHVQFCRACHDPCTGGIDTKIFGKDYKNVCSQLTIQFENPGVDELEYIKVLTQYGKKIAPDSVSWHVHN